MTGVPDTTGAITVAQFVVPGEPVSKARARFTGYGSKIRTYTPEKTHTAEETMAWAFRAAARAHLADKDYAYSVSVTFVQGTRQRRDIDNMVKLVLDALNKVAWADDNQVVEISARKMLGASGSARTEVAVHRLGLLERLTTPCAGCGEPINTYPSWRTLNRFCTVECQTAWRAARRLKTCPSCGNRFSDSKNVFCSPECRTAEGRVQLDCTNCGKKFSRFRSWSTNGNPMCSAECRAAYWRQHRAVAAKGICSFCGGPTSKKSYARCRACVYAGRVTP